MKLKKIAHIVLSCALLSSTALNARQSQGNQGNQASQGIQVAQGNQEDQASLCVLPPNTIETTTTDEEQENLQFMGEEEKLARDVYIYLNERWNLKVFVNIAKAEQNHIDSVKQFLDAYQITDLSVMEYGHFTNPDLQALYDTLIDKGSLTLIDALMVGALIEEVDIADLDNAISETNDPALIQMYQHLKDGSYNHLRAFVKQLGQQGIVNYTAQKLTQPEVDAILSGKTISLDTTQAISNTGEVLDSDSCIISSIITNDENDNSTFDGETTLTASSIILANQDLNQNVKLFAVISYLDKNQPNVFFMRDGDTWKRWDGMLSSLTSAQQITLQQQQTFDIFSFGLGELKGQIMVYIGYLKADGSLVYNPNAAIFRIQ